MLREAGDGLRRAGCQPATTAFEPACLQIRRVLGLKDMPARQRALPASGRLHARLCKTYKTTCAYPVWDLTSWLSGWACGPTNRDENQSTDGPDNPKRQRGDGVRAKPSPR